MISRVLAKEYLKTLKRNTYSILEDQGVFRTDFEIEINKEYIPSVYDRTMSRLNTRAQAEIMLTNLVQSVMQSFSIAHEQAQENEKLRQIKAAEDKIKEREERIRLKKEREEEKRKEEERRRIEDLKSNYLDSANKISRCYL